MTSERHSKFFCNEKENILKESMKGLALTNQDILYYPNHNFIISKYYQSHPEKVRLICGGGAGHEPAHANFVGQGLLSCVVSGDIFSSPSVQNIIKAIEEFYCDAGVILIVKNYTGDIINFSSAMQIFKRKNKKIDMVIVDDDISLINLNEESNLKFNKRRGLCGTVLLYKILGYLSEKNYTFEDILKYAKEIIPLMYTIGVSLNTCITPFNKINLNDEIPNDKIELGYGIHGEKGKEQVEFKNIKNVLKNIYDTFSKNITKDYYNNNKESIVILNDLGSLTLIEINIIIKNLLELYYEDKNSNLYNINLHRLIYGKLITSMDIKAFSLTLFLFDQSKFLLENKSIILEAIDYKVNNNYFNSISSPKEIYTNVNQQIIVKEDKEYNKISQNDNSKIRQLIKKLFDFLNTKVDYLNEVDQKVGDGDIGTGVLNAINNVINKKEYLNFELEFKNSLIKLGNFICEGFGGTSGPLYMSLIIGGINSLNDKENENSTVNYINALFEGTKLIQKIGGAEIGDRTMVDYLLPMSEFLLKNVNNIKSAFNEKRNGILETIKNLKALRGRSSYLSGKEIGFPDSGCVLADLWIGFIINEIENI